MTLKGNLIPIPENGISLKKSHSETIYVYFNNGTRVNKLGKTINNEIIIGKKDPLTGLLIPNSNYSQLFSSTENQVYNNTEYQFQPYTEYSYGRVFALNEIANNIGLQKCLKLAFPDKWQKLLAIAIYMVCTNNVMSYIDEFFIDNYIPFTSKLNDTQCSKLFASITRVDRINFFTEWCKLRRELECIAYDVTSISSYSDVIEFVSYGYNRDHDNLPQINLGMFYGMTSHLPISYEIYDGSHKRPK
ncbi:MAG: hypothetical protein LBQ12_14035 [Deltaproteobacteria bacterium]|jgi:hypothetical protein|nr:hypothetical protein [Deltaproteobacteria bacterium]